jgi:tripartite motif-containing protein 71
VQEFSPSGGTLGQFGSFGSGDGQFDFPSGIAIDPSGDVWVLDSENYRVQEFSPTGEYLKQFGEEGEGPGKLGWALGLAISGGNLYLSEPYAGRVQEFSASGAYVRAFDEKGAGLGESNVPYGIASEPGTGDLYVVEGASVLAAASANRVQEFSPEGSFITAFGSSGLGSGQLAGPRGVAAGASGQIYIADSGNQRIDEWMLP